MDSDPRRKLSLRGLRIRQDLSSYQRIAAERTKVQTQEVSGRGVRRRAAVAPKVP